MGFLFHLYQEAQTFWHGCPHKQGVKKRERFPQINREYHFRETSLLQEEVVQQQKIKVIQLSLLGDSPHVLGDVHKQYNIWEQLTSDELILTIVKEGITIDFHTLPRCPCAHPICHLNPTQQEAITSEVQHLPSLGVISENSYTPDRYISSVFTTEKRDHSLRMILNLKQLN